jgi:predicted transposase/invertase (TIGR01784 family)
LYFVVEISALLWYNDSGGTAGMTKLRYTFMNDTLFKMLFTKHPDLLKRLVAPILRIELDSIEKFEIRNPEMPPESLDDKFCRLDINMEVDGQRVDLEIQQRSEGGDYPERALYYWAREYSTALPESENYSALPRTAIISIAGFSQFPCTEYYSEFQALEVNRHTLLTDKFALYFFELPKLPKAVEADNIVELWLSLFNAKTEEELARLADTEVPEMREAINAYHHITVTPEFQEVERLRSKARHDEASALYGAKREKAFDIARIMIAEKEPIEKITKYTGLSREDIESLSQ